MPINPNKSFRSRRGNREVETMPISEAQMSSLISRMANEGVAWDELCTASLGHSKDLINLDFFEAANCIFTIGTWKNLKKGEYI